VDWSRFGLREGAPAVVYLHSPREKIWGILLALSPAGVALRGLDLAAFDDWMRQEAKGEEDLIGPTTVFYPMHRVERIERDESVGPIPSCAERFEREVGQPVTQAMGDGEDSPERGGPSPSPGRLDY
jgi:hypothetical protein